MIGVYLRALKSRRKSQINLAHGTKKTQEIRKKQKPSGSEKTVRVIVCEGIPKRRRRTTGKGFMEEVSFKSGGKKRESYGGAEWSTERGRSDG